MSGFVEILLVYIMRDVKSVSDSFYIPLYAVYLQVLRISTSLMTVLCDF